MASKHRSLTITIINRGDPGNIAHRSTVCDYTRQSEKKAMLTDYINSLFGEENTRKDERDTTALVSPRGVADEEGLQAYQDSIDMSGINSSIEEESHSFRSGRPFRSTSRFRDSIQCRMSALSDSLDSLPLHDSIRNSGVFNDWAQEDLADELENSGLIGPGAPERKNSLKRRLKSTTRVTFQNASPSSPQRDNEKATPSAGHNLSALPSSPKSPKSLGEKTRRPGKIRNEDGDHSARKGRRGDRNSKVEKKPGGILTDSPASTKGPFRDAPTRNTAQLGDSASYLSVKDDAVNPCQRLDDPLPDLARALEEYRTLAADIIVLLRAFDLDATDLKQRQQRARRVISRIKAEKKGAGRIADGHRQLRRRSLP